MARLAKLASVAKKVGSAGLSLAKRTPLGMVASGLGGAAAGFVAGRMTAKGTGKKKRRTTPAKLVNKIRIYQLRKKLSQVRGY